MIDNFIADFYCHKAKLVIEIDGSHRYIIDKTIKERMENSEKSATKRQK